MKNKLPILAIILGLISFSFTGDAIKNLIPGTGIADEIVIGQTTRADIEKKYGSDFTEQKHYAKKNGDSTLYSTSLYYEKQGLSFYFKPASPGLFSVNFYASFPAISDKGIRAGVSTMKDVEKAYGKSEWYTSGKTMILEYKGIEFYIPFNGKYPIKKSVYRQAEKTLVDHIGITAIEQ